MWDRGADREGEGTQRKADLDEMPPGTGSGKEPRGEGDIRTCGDGARFGREEVAVGDLRAIPAESCG